MFWQTVFRGRSRPIMPKALKGGEEWHGPVHILWIPISLRIQQLSEHVSVLVLFLDSSVQRGRIFIALVDISICLKMLHRCMTTLHRADPGDTRFNWTSVPRLMRSAPICACSLQQLCFLDESHLKKILSYRQILDQLMRFKNDSDRFKKVFKKSLVCWLNHQLFVAKSQLLYSLLVKPTIYCKSPCSYYLTTRMVLL